MSDAPPFHRVVIRKDPSAPLHYLRCQQPCTPQRMSHPVWCMPAVGEVGCYLGGSLTVEGARTMAKAAGYEVVEP